MKYAISLMLILSFAGIACAQKSSDPNKFAIIINGAGGEAVYAKQFEEWTGQLSAVLSSRFGFDAKQLTVLKGATAEDVKRTFTTLKTQLDANNVLFVFLIGHGSFDGRNQSSIWWDLISRRLITTRCFRRCRRIE